MARPKTKDELIESAVTEFDKLWQAVISVDGDNLDVAGACDAWSVKDLLAHLHAWHVLFLGWESDHARGVVPSMPADGYSWAEIPALNNEIYRRYADSDWEQIEDRLRRSHTTMLRMVGSYSEADLFTRQRFSWTGSTSMASYAISAMSSHYAWASKLIRRWARSSTNRTLTQSASQST